ncbi:MAG: peroxiredoxin, partial [Microbacteriaceae bacterium]|nr:peroxiredoxin [Microbacteriaceae bacterium]
MSSSIAVQVAEFNVGFNEAVGPVLAEVFADEQATLNTAGLPTSTVGPGDVIPDARLVSPNGDAVSLYSALGSTTTVVVFYRGSWCPYCNLTLKHYQQTLLPQLTARGVKLIAISPQTPEASELAIANGELEFTVLSDPGNILVSQLGILTEPTGEARAAHTQLGFDVAESNADSTGGIPFPTV